MSHLFSLVAVLLYTLLPQPSSGDGVSLGEPILRDKFINPRDQILDRGAKANLTCRPLDNDFQFQFWSFILNGSGQLYEVISDLAQFGYSLEPTNRNGRLTTNLIIDSVEDRHETYYQCVMKNGSESLYYSDGAQVIIFEQADVKFHKDTPISDKVFTAQAGSPATLSIEVSGKPTPMLTLQKQAGSTWTTVTDERFIVNASQIYVSYVKMGDSGKYQLIVNNTVDRRISLLFEIRVEGGGWTAKMIDSALEKKNVASSVCPGFFCPVPPCANPKYEVNSCCPTCKHSACMFSGCVEYSRAGLGSKWHPDPCTSCYCITDQPICIRTHCPTLQCPKYQVVHRQGECCASCDYSRLNQELCDVVVDEMVNITIQDKQDGVLREVRGPGMDGLCSLKVVKHRCSRDIFRHNNLLYSCQPRSRKRQINVGNVCGLERARIAFKDVVHCLAKPMFQSSERGGTDHSNEYCNVYFPITTRP